MFGGGDVDKMRILADSIAEPDQTPGVAHAEGDKDMVDTGSFWTRLKRKLFRKK